MTESEKQVSRRDFLKLAAAAGVAFVVGAGAGYYAGSQKKPEVITKTVPGTPPTSPTPPPTSPTPTKSEVVIGVIAPMATKQGMVQRNAAELAIREINEAGGVLGMPVRLVWGDTKLNPDVAVSEFRRLVTVEKADFMTGGFSSGIMNAMMEPMAELKIPFLADASSPGHPAKVHEEYDKYKYWFRITQNNGATFAWDLADMFDMLDEKGYDVSHIYIIRDEHIWTDAVMSYLQPELDKRGITVAKDVKVGRGYTEYEPLLVEANDMGIQVVVPILAIAGTGDVLAKQWANLKLRLLLAGHDLAALDLGFYEATGGAAEGYIFLADGGVVNTAPPTDMCKQFIQNYTAQYGHPPEAHQGFGAYDAVYLFKKVVEMAHDDGVENPFDPDVVVQYLEKFNPDNPINLTRTIAFYPPGDKNKFDHDLVWGDNYVRNWISQWQNGKQYVIRGKIKNADMIEPPWF